MKNILPVLQERGLVDAITSEALNDLLQKPLRLYAGFDPSSDSLHLGNLIPIILLGWFVRFGHTPIAIVGGATGMIGDPGGKSVERNLLDGATIEKNIKGIRRSLESVLKQEVQILNNYDWFRDFKYIDFLRDIGKHFRVNTMLAKDSVRSRLQSEEGISYTEFSYQLLQSYDFLYLFDHYNVTLQIGGSDQWGNITAGTELIRKMRGVSVQGLTFPLLTRSDGKKFGKSEEGAIWLNEDKLSPYDLYQYLFRVADADVIKMLKMLTYIDLSEIIEIERAMQQSNYETNSAQRVLARSVTEIVHGKEGVLFAETITEAARPGAITNLDRNTLEQLAKEMPSITLNEEKVIGSKISDLFVAAGLQQSKGEAKRLICNGGAYINNEKVTNDDGFLTKDNIVENAYILLGVGKKRKMVIKIAEKK